MVVQIETLRTGSMNILNWIFGKKEEPVTTYEDFWNWFKQHERRFHHVVKKGKNIEAKFFDKIGPKLNELRDGYFYLTGMCDESTAELIITADGIVKNFVFVEELVKHAPTIPGWKFTAHKPELNIDDVSISLDQFSFAQENLFFVPKENATRPDEIDIGIVYKDYDEQFRTEITNGVYIFLDNYLGELNFATAVDELTIVGKTSVEKDVIPIGKLKDYLKWREKEFIEKYDGKRFTSDNDMHAVFEAELEGGKPLVAVMNTDLLEWKAKVSHPWILVIDAKYDGSENNGLPDQPTLMKLEQIEQELLNSLEPLEGVLYVGRQTGGGSREIFFACNDFRTPVKAADAFFQKQSVGPDYSYDIFKDKYWKTFRKFSKAEVM
jgi:hypothetical protein